MATGIQARLGSSEGRRFALTVGGAFLALGAVAWWRGRVPVAMGCASVGGALVAAGLVIPSRLGPIYSSWMALADTLGRITAPVFLGVLYFAVVAPVGLIMRLVGRRPLPHPTAASSGWIARNARVHRPEDMKHQF